MPVDYAEVMRELEAREGQLLTELNTLRGAKPAIKILMDAQVVQQAMAQPKGRYANMGTTGAVRDLYASSNDLMTREEIFAKLKAGGWTSDAREPLASLSATLSQMVTGNELERIEDRWRKKLRNVIPDENDTTLSKETPTTIGEMYLRERASVSQLLSSQSPSDAQA